MRTPLPDDEGGRLSALNRYQILDTPAESEFDDITLLAAQLCGTPIALISLLDEERQWFKSRHGLATEETPREISFCTYAILSSTPDVFLVSDALADERFATNPLVVEEPNIRFYAGAPLITPDKHALGTLCVIDREPRQLSPQQLAALQALARQVCLQLELRRASAMLARANEELRGLSLTDDLTGLLNRRGFLFHAEQQLKLARAQRSQKRLMLFYADMDRLKQINDRFGHQEGSQAIRATGEVLKKTFRESDIVARLGGDEFTVLAINTDEDSDQIIIRRLHERLREYNTQHRKPYELALSVGVALASSDENTSTEDVIAEADAAMYAHKRSKQIQRDH